MSILISLLLIFGLPLAGIILAGQPIFSYLQLPPQVDFLVAAPFSWIGFAIIGGFIALTCGPILWKMVRMRVTAWPELARRAFPWWGWAAIPWTALWWALAWSRLEWFQPFQAHTFAPLWSGYIVFVNAITFARTGRSLLTHRPGHLLKLFPLSAAFWWSFEYLNRFVQNWHYHGTEGFSTLQHVLLASFAFSTVLPAVISTKDLLATFRRLTLRTEKLPMIDTENSRWIAIAMLLTAAVAMLLIGIMPNYLFPLLWMAPVLIVTSVQRLAGKNTIFSKLKHGDWTPVLLPAMAALICGFFWEMWNVHSLAHWTYTVPFVHRFQIFEMPLLGYAGYLPFGLECATIVGWISNSEFVGSNRPKQFRQSHAKHLTPNRVVESERRSLASPRAAKS